MAKFIQINMNRAAVAQAELAINVANNKLDIALLQEPVVYKGKLIQVRVQGQTHSSTTWV